MMTEQAPPNQLVRDVRAAEEIGFDFSARVLAVICWFRKKGPIAIREGPTYDRIEAYS